MVFEDVSNCSTARTLLVAPLPQPIQAYRNLANITAVYQVSDSILKLFFPTLSFFVPLTISYVPFDKLSHHIGLLPCIFVIKILIVFALPLFFFVASMH